MMTRLWQGVMLLGVLGILALQWQIRQEAQVSAAVLRVHLMAYQAGQAMSDAVLGTALQRLQRQCRPAEPALSSWAEKGHE